MCERALFGHSAKGKTSLRSCTGFMLIPVFSSEDCAGGGVDRVKGTD